MSFKSLAPLLAGAAAAPIVASAPAQGHTHSISARGDDAEVRAEAWELQGDWIVAPADELEGGGSRVAALAEVEVDGSPLAIEARGVDGAEIGAWHPLEETYRGDRSRVATVDLERTWPAAELRIALADDARIGEIAWELVDPRFPRAGERARRAERERTLAGAEERPLDPELEELGVISRSEWGARPTGCTAEEDHWHRMAIHHTAGGQTSGGSVSAEVRAIQAYHQDSGVWCDIAYQFLVGHDGRLFEGRELHLRSGATGGANAGNVAISFLGCYHPSGCPGENHAVTEAMMEGALDLIHTLGAVYDIPVDSESIRGHRDYGGGTACPGDFVHDRLDELRREPKTGSDYAAELAATSWGDRAGAASGESGGEAEASAETVVAIEDGARAHLWAVFENTGERAWEPGETYLAPSSPRDEPSRIRAPSWPAPDRAATVAREVEPGESATFYFAVSGVAEELEQRFGLVHEGETWFADENENEGEDRGGAAIALRIRPAQPAEGGASAETDTDGEVVRGGCRAGGQAPAGGALALLAVALCIPLARGAARAARRARDVATADLR